MAKQDGFHPVIGTLGKTTFYRTKDGYIAREKSQLSADRMKYDPAFKRQRETMAEFGRAGRAGKLIRTSLNKPLNTTSDKRLIRRLTAEMMKVVTSDSTNRRGSRTVQHGDLAILKGFEFNANSLLSVVSKVPLTATVDRTGGTLSIGMPSFIPSEVIKGPAGCTHFKFLTAAGEFDFEKNTAIVDIKEGNLVPLDNTATQPVSTICNVTPGSNLPLFLFCGILYYQELNGEIDLLTSGTFNALQIVEVNTI